MKLRLWVYLSLLAVAGATPVFGQQAGNVQIHRLSLPNKDWALDVPLTNFTVVSEEIRTTEVSKDVKVAGLVYDFTANQVPATNTAAASNKKASPQRLVMFSVHLEPAQAQGTAADFRDITRKKMTKLDAVDKDSVKAFEYGQIPLIRYNLDLANLGLFTMNEEKPQDKGLKAFFVKDDVWITVGLGVKPFKKEDEQFFYSILDSVKIVDNRTASTSFDYYQKGRALSLLGKSRESIPPLSKALELEQQQRQLGKTQWRNLVWSLVDAYRATGNRSGFEEVLNYGLDHDPAYYRFHLTKARMFASEDKLDGAIASLEKAFRSYQAESPQVQYVEHLIDPLSDPAFARFRKDEKFRQAVKEIRKEFGKWMVTLSP